MAITIHKLKQPKKEHGKITRGVILDDGAKKKLTYLGGLTEDESEQRTAILARGKELFDKGHEWAEHHLTADFKSKLPDIANVNASNSVPELKAQVAFLLEAVELLFEMVD